MKSKMRQWFSLLLVGAIALSCKDDLNIASDQPIISTDALIIDVKNSTYKEKQDNSTWTPVYARVINFASNPPTPPINAWGGRTDKKATAMKGADGFFRLGKIGNRWVFIDPDNGTNIIHGTQNVNPVNTIEFSSRFATNEDWALETSTLMKNIHINCIDYGGVRPAAIPLDMAELLLRPSPEVKNAYNVQLSMLRSYMWDNSRTLAWAYDDTNPHHNRLNLIFEPSYEEYLDREVQRICDIFRDDIHLLGYQLDNELGFRGWDDRFGGHGILLNHFLSLPSESYARQYAEVFVDEFKLNRADILSVSQAAHIEAKGLRQAFDEFRSRVAEKYYKMYHDAIKKYDSNHLILGSRLHSLGMYDKETLVACAKYNDVITINYYQTWQPDPLYMNNIRNWTNDTPFFITEFYTKGADANFSGVPYNNKTGGGWIVPSQIDRSYFYQNFCIGLLEAQNCVGWTHFAYNDVFTSTTADNGNRGIVSAQYHPYPAFVDGMSRLNRNVYVLSDYFDNRGDK